MDHQFREVWPITQPGLPIPWNAVQHETVHSGAPAENATQDPVGSSALDDQPRHHSPRSAQVAGYGGVYGNAAMSWKVAPLTSPVVSRHSWVPEDRELVWQDHSSSVSSTGGGLVGISSSPARSSPRHLGNGSYSLHGWVQLGLESPARLMLDTGTVVCISKIVAHKRSGDAGHHQCCERLPASSEVPGGSLDVRQRSHGCLHQEQRGHAILHSHAADDTPAEVVQSQGDKAGSQPSARSAQCPGGLIVQDRPDSALNGQWRWSVFDQCLPSGWTTDRHVCYIRQQTTYQVCIVTSGPQGRVDGHHVHPLGQWEGPPVCFHAIQVGPSGPAEDLPVSRHSNDTDSSAAGNSFLVSRASGAVPDPIPLHVQGQPLLTQDVILSDGGTKLVTTDPQIYMHGDFAGHLSGKGPFTGSCRYDVKIPTSLI